MNDDLAAILHWIFIPPEKSRVWEHVNTAHQLNGAGFSQTVYSFRLSSLFFLGVESHSIGSLRMLHPHFSSPSRVMEIHRAQASMASR
jgi:hypothetical protein